MFEEASRLKLRFESTKGLAVGVEDLWEANLNALNGIAVNLHNKLKNDDISFINPEKTPDRQVQLRFDIVRHIIKVRLEEQQQAENSRHRAAEKQKLLGYIARKQDAELEGKTLEELTAMVNAL